MPFPAGISKAHGRAPAASDFPASRRRLRSRLVSLAAAMLCVGGTVLGVESAGTRVASASVGSDKSRIAQLEQQIEQQGELVQSLVDRSNVVQGRLLAVEERIAVERLQLAAEQRSFAVAHAKLGQVAIEAYADGGSFSADWTDASSTTAADEQGVYAGVADGVLDDAMNAVELDERQLTITGVKLQADETSLTTTLHQLSAAQRLANAAIVEDEQTLSQVKGNLQELVIQAALRAEEAKVEQEEEEAAQQEAEHSQPPPVVPPVITTTPPVSVPNPPSQSTPPPPPPVSSGGYADPLRAIAALSPERVDQGVDYSGFGPIYALGDGVVVSTVNGGWPGGTFIVYQLTDGPASGLYAYAAEDIDPEVSVGQSVTPNTVIGQMYEGPDGIET